MHYTPHQATDLLCDHYCTQMIMLLKQMDRHFGIVCKSSAVRFDMPVPKEELAKLGSRCEFMISGKTFESLEIKQDSLKNIFLHFIVGLTPGGREVVSVRVRGIEGVFIQNAHNENYELFKRVDPALMFPKDTAESNTQGIIKDSGGDGEITELNTQEEQSLHAIFSKIHNRRVLKHLARKH